MKPCVIGLGKAGLPLAAVIARSGLTVMGVDIDPKRVAMLNAGENPLPEEPGLAELIKEHAGKGFVATNDYSKACAECDAFIVIVPLFIDDNKKCDFSIMDSVFSELAKGLKKGDLVVLETTVPPKTTETRIKDLLEKSGLKAGVDFHLAYSPERIMTGYSISRYSEFPKVVGGITDASGEAARELYSHFCSNVTKVKDSRTAELIKVSEGVYRDVNISLANELAHVCEELDVDFWEMREHANHAFCQIHEPGSVGGHCIPVYPWFLIHNHEVPLTSLARSINDDQVIKYADKVPADAKRVAVVGLSYRPNVKETAYTRSIPLLAVLREKGFETCVFDPMYSAQEMKDMGFEKTESFENCDAVIVMNKEETAKKLLSSFSGTVVDVKGLLRE